MTAVAIVIALMGVIAHMLTNGYWYYSIASQHGGMDEHSARSSMSTVITTVNTSRYELTALEQGLVQYYTRPAEGNNASNFYVKALQRC